MAECIANADISEYHKTKTHFAQIVVGGTVEKPCYSIMYFDPEDNEFHIGYSSYCLDYVLRWLEEEFEVSGENEPVKHGRWIPLEYDGYADGSPVWDLWECSKCQEEHSGDEDTLTPYCPNCGAKMDLEG
ncbi:MAG: hypothetical protein J6J01_06685 [Oscillospiraceae bacterium]|nr:hypothetical protein [Oscillospiraceae bacterium]